MSAESVFGYRPTNPKPYFIVKNITHLKNEKKVIKIFNYPILPNGERDLMNIPGISVDIIESSLMSGTLKHKILSKEIVISSSSLDLLQFDEAFKLFLYDAGIEQGVEIPAYDGYVTATLPYVWKMDVKLIGVCNGVNRVFYTPDKFISGIYENNQFAINIFHNGRRLNESAIEFSIGKTDNRNDDYDIINFISFKPNEASVLTANYVVRVT